jgi:cyclopropane-fatty-acyl-phospholipid synthase
MSHLKVSATSRFDRSLTGRLSSAIGSAPVRLALWDGSEYCPHGVVPVGTVLIKKRSALLKLLLEPELYFGEGYSAGDIEVEGNLIEMLDAVYRAGARQPSSRWFPALLARWLSWAQANSLSGSRRNIRHHYDIGTSFYQLWLDPQLVYTCAYFKNPDDTLEDAQIAKMDHVCRKLRLQPGDSVVEAGCGWGALALHMARKYGVTVKAFNISRDQINYARRRADLERLGARVEFIEDDYRNLSGTHDAFVSVGMLEHVGLNHYRDFGAVINRCLSKRGRGFIHFIGRNRPKRLSLWTRRRIFPGGYVPALREALGLLEDWDFSILDVENLRLHYARTLQHWLERYERSRETITEMFSPEFVRMWRLYLTGSIAAFRSGSMQLFQISFARGSDNAIPWTRDHIYAAHDENEREKTCIPAMS